jgi:hypothetical protein
MGPHGLYPPRGGLSGDDEKSSIGRQRGRRPSWGSGEVFAKNSQRYRPRGRNGASARSVLVLLEISHQKWSASEGHFGARSAVRRFVSQPSPEDI